MVPSRAKPDGVPVAVLDGLPSALEHEDHGTYIAEGSTSVACHEHAAARDHGARLMIPGGATLNGRRPHLVEPLRLVARCDLPADDRDEHIPLPE
jgi:uncharacterized Zn-binding protein involved in type VI secretion